MGLITVMDYGNGHLYVSWSHFYLDFEDRVTYIMHMIGSMIVWFRYHKIEFHSMG